eukprot:3818721-Rhodomonas_salina.1
MDASVSGGCGVTHLRKDWVACRGRERTVPTKERERKRGRHPERVKQTESGEGGRRTEGRDLQVEHVAHHLGLGVVEVEDVGGEEVRGALEAALEARGHLHAQRSRIVTTPQRTRPRPECIAD